MNEALLAACNNGDPQQIVDAMLPIEFWLVNISEEGDDETSALVVEAGEFPAIVGFSSEDHAGTFAGADEDWLNEEGELPCFRASGKEFITNLPRSFGIALNPETEHFFLFEPALVRKMKGLCHKK